jgi:hypothetical protein
MSDFFAASHGVMLEQLEQLAVAPTAEGGSDSASSFAFNPNYILHTESSVGLQCRFFLFFVELPV